MNHQQQKVIAVIPRSLFAADGSLLLPTDRSSIIHAVEIASMQAESEQISAHLRDRRTAEFADSVLIVDAMAILQSMSKGPNIKRMVDLKTSFVKRCKGMVRTYSEGRFIFDRYQAESLKDKKRLNVRVT